LSLSAEKLQADLDKLKAEEADKSAKLAELSLQIDRREQAKQVCALLVYIYATCVWSFGFC